jgi:hypothetical protein
MILEAARKLGIDLGKSFMVGDRGSDVEAGRAAGCTTMFIDLGYAELAPDAPDYVVHSIREVAMTSRACSTPRISWCRAGVSAKCFEVLGEGRRLFRPCLALPRQPSGLAAQADEIVKDAYATRCIRPRTIT